MKLARRESDVLKVVKQWLELHHWLVLRMNTGAFAGTYKGRTRFVRFGISGQADLLAIRRVCGSYPWPSVQVCWLECKSSTGEQGVHQAAFARLVEQYGCSYRLVRGIEDLEGLE